MVYVFNGNYNNDKNYIDRLFPYLSEFVHVCRARACVEYAAGIFFWKISA